MTSPDPTKDALQRATSIDIFNFSSRSMREFHVTWVAFFICFFAWFGVAPLMGVISDDLQLTRTQVGNTVIASVAGTVVARILVGALCDHFGPRRTYRWLMILCAFPVSLVGLAQSYESFLLFRLAIGAVGASFVITQFHTSLMFAPNCSGTALATTAAWGNLGGGVTQFAMPLAVGFIAGFGIDAALGWRFAMLGPGMALLVMGILYPRLTTDTPSGEFRPRIGEGRSLGEAMGDFRVWCLFGLYAACFGMELTINNIAALHFAEVYDLGLMAAGFAAATFGLTNIFARTLGGYFSDRVARTGGLKARARILGGFVLVEGLLLMAFARSTPEHLGSAALGIAVVLLICFSIFVQMAEGATFSLVSFIKPRALGAVVGLVASGGNVGAVLAGLLFRREDLPWGQALLILGAIVAALSLLAFLIRFSPEEEAQFAPRSESSSSTPSTKPAAPAPEVT